MAQAMVLNNAGRNVYWTLNPLRPDRICGLNEAAKRSYQTAEDADIDRIAALLYDIDPSRLNPDGSLFRLYELPDGSHQQLEPAEVKKFNTAAKLAGTPKLKRVSVAATDTEKNAALEVAHKLLAFWESKGADITLTDSGNGYYVIVRVDLALADKTLIADILEQHAEEFDTPFAEIDTSASNPSRVTRVPGTVNRKGPDSPERPHRTAQVLFHHNGCALSADDLRAIFPIREKTLDDAQEPVCDEELKESCEMMENFLRHHGIGHYPGEPWKGGFIYHLDEDEDACPNGSGGSGLHSTDNLKSTISVMVSASGKLGYKCLHGNCTKLAWRDFRDFHEGAALDRLDEAIKSYDLAVEAGQSIVHLQNFRGPFFKTEAEVPAAFVWSSRKNLSPGEHEHSDRSEWRQEGPLWIFTKETDFALFKYRAEKTPAWASAATWTNPEGWPELPADYEAWKASQPPTESGFKFAKVRGKVSDYMLLPRHSSFDGWCGRGRTHIIAGSSGSGKTTLMIPLLHDQWCGKTVFGHAGAGLQPLVIFADRGELSNEETLLRLGLTTSSLPIRYLSDAIDDRAVDEILSLIEDQSPVPEVVFVEGADELVSKASDSAIVSRFMNGIKAISGHYHIAFVLSVGAPKSRPKDQHALVRDRVFGSEKWARKSDMIMSLTAQGDGTGKDVQLVVQHRNAAVEKFDMEFANGKLVEKEPMAEDIDALEAWMCGQDWFTRSEAVAALKEYAGMSKASVNKRIFQMIKAKRLETRPSKDKKVEELRLKRGAQSPEQREMELAIEGTF
jgi:hypothetical protein